MATAIRPSQFRGGVPFQGGLPQSPLEALTNVLDATIDLGTDIAVRAKDKELEEGERLLANPLITESEIFEIQRDAQFPLLKLKAENRRGGLIAELSRSAAVDAVSKEDDPIEARRVLTQLQKDTLDPDLSDGVLAGIRERYAEFSPQLLADASARRVAKRDRQEVVDLDADLTESLNTGILAFGTTLSGAIIDEKFVVNGDLGAFYDNVVVTLQNFYLKGDDNTEVNLNASRAIAAIDLVLESDFKLKPVERKKFSALRQKIEDAEEASLTRSVSSGNDAKKRIHTQAAIELAQRQAIDPFGPVDVELLQRGLASSSSASEARAFSEAVHAAPEDSETTGVANAQVWVKARSTLITAFKSSIEGQILELTADQIVALDLFDGVAESLPSELREDRVKLQGVAAGFVREAIKRSVEFSKVRLKRVDDFNRAFKGLIDEAEEAATAGNFEDAIAINLEIAKEREVLLVQKRQEVIDLWISEHGYVRTDFVNTHKP